MATEDSTPNGRHEVFDPENPAAYFKSLAIKRAELA